MCTNEFEQQILDCWKIVDELKLVSEAVGDDKLSADSIMNILNGMTELYELKFDKLFNVFEEGLRARKNST